MLKLIVIILYVLCSFQYNVESNEIENCDIDLAQIQNDCQLKLNNILKEIREKTPNSELLPELTQQLFEICKTKNFKSALKIAKTNINKRDFENESSGQTLAEIKDEFDYKFNTSIKIYEKRFEYLTNQFEVLKAENSEPSFAKIKNELNLQFNELFVKNFEILNKEFEAFKEKMEANMKFKKDELILETNDNICGDWVSFKVEKCFKVINEDKLMTYEEAVKLCSQSANGSSLITIHSEDEQEFLVNYLFETRKIVENIWLGLYNNNNKFKWIDRTYVEFTNWANGSPTNESDHKCVKMSSETTSIGKWVDIQCSRKLITVCERPPVATNNYLQKILFENMHLLKETQKELKESKTFNSYLGILSNNYFSFIDTDGKFRAFIFPLKSGHNWDEANNICKKYNATLIEINSSQKQIIFQSFLKNNSYSFSDFWLNAHKDSSGKWKWLRSGNDTTYTNWESGYPNNNVNMLFHYDPGCSGHNKWRSTSKTSISYIVCELEVNL